MDTIEVLKAKIEALLRARLELAHRQQLTGNPFNDFDILAYLGSGSFGSVLLVREKLQRLRRQVLALKVIPKKTMRLKTKERIHAEKDILLLSKGNPWIVELYRTFQDSSNLYLVMEFIPGGDLSSFLAEYGCFTEGTTNFVVYQLAQALSFIHSKGYAHRDIKPDNILVDLHGNIKIIDMGLVKRLRNADGTVSRAFSIVGTFDYIAPEILSRQGYTYEVDYWSLGTVMFECLTGYPPFNSPDAMDTCRKIVRFFHFLKIPHETVAKVSASCLNLLLGLLQHAPLRFNCNAIRSHIWLKDAQKNENAASPLLRSGNARIVASLDKLAFETSTAEVLDDVQALVVNFQADKPLNRHAIGKKHYRLDRNTKYIGYSFVAPSLPPTFLSDLTINTAPSQDDNSTEAHERDGLDNFSLSNASTVLYGQYSASLAGTFDGLSLTAVDVGTGK